MFSQYFLRVAVPLVSLLLVACSVNNIPAPEQFRATPVGTPLPPGADRQPVQIAGDTSGVLFTNQSSKPIKVAINESIVDIPVTESFLFILPPGTQQFYIYELNENPKAYSETTQAGKVRYVYYRDKGGQ
jgi:hypothetical protein